MKSILLVAWNPPNGGFPKAGVSRKLELLKQLVLHVNSLGCEMNGITFWYLLHTARRLKQRGWPLHMRLAYLTGVLSVKHETFLDNNHWSPEFRLSKKGGARFKEGAGVDI